VQGCSRINCSASTKTPPRAPGRTSEALVDNDIAGVITARPIVITRPPSAEIHNSHALGRGRRRSSAAHSAMTRAATSPARDAVATTPAGNANAKKTAQPPGTGTAAGAALAGIAATALLLPKPL